MVPSRTTRCALCANRLRYAPPAPATGPERLRLPAHPGSAPSLGRSTTCLPTPLGRPVGEIAYHHCSRSTLRGFRMIGVSRAGNAPACSLIQCRERKHPCRHRSQHDAGFRDSSVICWSVQPAADALDIEMRSPQLAPCRYAMAGRLRRRRRNFRCGCESTVHCSHARPRRAVAPH